MKITPLRTDVQYEAALARVADLIGHTDEASLDELEVWTALIERYEKPRFTLDLPSPVAAIRFRMEQAGLKPKNLEAILGSRSRVSEILSGNRALTLDMIRALNKHLQIPAEVLIGTEAAEAVAKAPALSVAALKKLRDLGAMKARETFEAFMERAFGQSQLPALLRKTRTERTNAKTDDTALAGWLAAVTLIAEDVQIEKPKRKVKGADLARKLAKLSVKMDGPIRARTELAAAGIVLVTLEHLPGTYLDGAAMCRSDGTRVIALTLRHDRIDNFWFTLLHELCHATEHLGEDRTLILDDLELKSSDDLEDEADTFARDALIPPEIWKANVSSELGIQDVKRIAKKAGVNPAIVAGRWQREHNDYRRFSKILGRGEVRSQPW